MPRIKILNEFSYRQGKEIVFRKYPHLVAEINRILANAEIPKKSKVSQERGRKGQLVWSGKDFNRPLRTSFKLAGWRKKRIELSEKNFVEIDLCKEKVGISFQFGKYSFVDTDFIKFEIFYLRKELDVGVEILPTRALRSEMYSGPPDFDQVIARIKARGEISPVPLWIVGANVFG